MPDRPEEKCSQTELTSEELCRRTDINETLQARLVDLETQLFNLNRENKITKGNENLKLQVEQLKCTLNELRFDIVDVEGQRKIGRLGVLTTFE